MGVRNLDKIFRPRRIAVVGASDNPAKVGFMVLRNLVGHGYDGVVYPVNSQRESVQGIAAYPSLRHLPHAPDLAVICTPAATVPPLIADCGESGVMGVVIITAGFREVGAEGRLLEKQVGAEAARFPGLRIIGPNCLGIMVPPSQLNVSFSGDIPPAGHIAFISQSGALCTAVVEWAQAGGVGFSHVISVGNMLDVGMDDLLDYLAADPQTTRGDAVRRIGHGSSRFHVGGAGLLARQADRGLQGRTVCRVGAGRLLAHRSDGRRR